MVVIEEEIKRRRLFRFDQFYEKQLHFKHSLNLPETDNNEESIKSILDEELRLVENALRKNFKSYRAWHHRKWVLSKGHSSTDRELLLLGKFQKADSHNFHAWNYRRLSQH
ncbi:hypothetical protein HAX54_026214 [Datura stramonium]|uniref:Geranylgeranyl transferase type-2 subunit alpha n=1 Tax=Datura stramonium TaxID=4076 RepID=A0ABS8S7B7_DATST|nr:hypothetical protein [Datura stramonium]